MREIQDQKRFTIFEVAADWPIASQEKE